MNAKLEEFKKQYKAWVEERLPDFRAGRMKQIVEKSRQRRVIMDALEALQKKSKPGSMQELPYRWQSPDPT